MCNGYTNSSQIKLPNQIYHGSRSPISVMTELAVLPAHGISTFCTIHVCNTKRITGCTILYVYRLKQFEIDININTHKKSECDYEKIIAKLYSMEKIKSFIWR